MSFLLKQNQLEDLCDGLEKLLGHKIKSIKTHYSGRGMYGRTCLGIVTNNDHFICNTLAFYCSQHESDINNIISTFRSQLQHPNVDNMGKDYIVYFPSLLTDIDNSYIL